MNRLRRNYGLHWKGELPEATELGFNLTNALIILVLMLAYGIVGSIDYAVEQDMAAEQAEARVAEQQAAMLACLNGGSPGYYTMTKDGHRAYLVCNVHEVTDENVRRAM